MSHSNDHDDWEFSVDENSQVSLDDEQELVIANLENQKEQKLTLEVNKRKRMTRAQLAEEMDEGVEIIQATYSYASFAHRSKAFIIDIISFCAIVLLVYFLSFWQKDLFKSFGDHIYADFFFLDFTSASLVLVVIFYFIFFILPLVGSAKSPGKFIMGISCYSKGMKPLGVIQTLFREILIKPISVISLVGIIFILLNKKKKGLHDIICGTLVVVD